MADINFDSAKAKPVHAEVKAAYDALTAPGESGITVLDLAHVNDVSKAVGGLGESGASIAGYNSQVYVNIANFINMAIAELHTIERSLDSTIKQVDEHEKTRRTDGDKVATGARG